jgi:hypothetical protein
VHPGGGAGDVGGVVRVWAEVMSPLLVVTATPHDWPFGPVIRLAAGRRGDGCSLDGILGKPNFHGAQTTILKAEGIPLKHTEREHVHREESDFRRLARRNKLFGLWVAEQLGLHGDAAEAYSREVIYSDLEEPGEDDMFRKVTADLERHGKTVTREQLVAKLGDCLNEAHKEVR